MKLSFQHALFDRLSLRNLDIPPPVPWFNRYLARNDPCNLFQHFRQPNRPGRYRMEILLCFPCSADCFRIYCVLFLPGNKGLQP